MKTELTFDMLPVEQQEFASQIGMPAYSKLIEICGGGPPLYIPRLAELERNQRNRRIQKDFNGRNYHELALKYKLTERSIRRIVRHK